MPPSCIRKSISKASAWCIREKNAGFLTARRNCEYVLEGFRKEGGEYRQLAVEPGSIASGKMQALKLSDGSELAADTYVFCCGPWLGKVFPGLLGNMIHPTRQEVFFFGTPAGDPRYLEAQMPTWIDNSGKLFYGIPGNQWRGFKLANDGRGPAFDPTTGERLATSEGVRQAREYMEFRFPGMRGAPLVETRVCQYENTTDSISCLTAIRKRGTSGWAAAVRDTVTNMGRRWAKNSRTWFLGKRPVDPFFSLASRQKGEPKAN